MCYTAALLYGQVLIGVGQQYVYRYTDIDNVCVRKAFVNKSLIKNKLTIHTQSLKKNSDVSL